MDLVSTIFYKEPSEDSFFYLKDELDNLIDFNNE